jgi:hypothetical protein
MSQYFEDELVPVLHAEKSRGLLHALAILLPGQTEGMDCAKRETRHVLTGTEGNYNKDPCSDRGLNPGLPDYKIEGSNAGPVVAGALFRTGGSPNSAARG